ncbi:acetate/propionate family kinase [Loktanella sp. S4079]|uniref:acetate/propionate family kinase n=1 Tax=Loktanella sp. S4079 TaxID=579483 RepID=UPI0005F9F897|nr:acetate kinase [Loktanella sp. S4079]KJZ20695.1 acetate kinase [Loktanella sp. S4079]
MILVVNAGSSSLKVSLFTTDLTQIADGAVSNIGGASILTLNDQSADITAKDHASALQQMLGALDQAGHKTTDISAVAHRVVHGGAYFSEPARVTPEVIEAIRACIPLAPLHNPVNLLGIEAINALRPDMPQFVSFDTAFHATNPDIAKRYAIPDQQYAQGIQRYGFHGSSYANMVSEFGDALPDRLLALHLGNGASLCAIRYGQSVASSMGYSPMSGLVMGTRCGEIDGAAVLRIAHDLGLSEADHLLNKQSGLKGLAGDNNMKNLLARSDANARFAVDHFCYWAAREAGSAIVAMGGVDAIAFTGGIGENAAPIRDKILDHLAFLGSVDVHIIPADEERQIARDAIRIQSDSTS